MPTICLRFFTVYGPRGRPDMAPHKFAEKIFSNEKISLFIDETGFKQGKMARDFTYISDIIEGIILSLNTNISFEIINLGRGSPINLKDFISILEKNLGKKATKEFIGKQEGDVTITYANISKAKQILNYSPRISLDEGINLFIKWYLKNLKK